MVSALIILSMFVGAVTIGMSETLQQVSQRI
jgi:hypothetical protein